MDLSLFIPQLRQALGDPAALAALEQAGLLLLESNYHAAVPTSAQIQESFEYQEDELPFAACGLFDHPLMRQQLQLLIDAAKDYHPPLEGDRRAPQRFFFDNPMFSGCDALAYYAMIRRLKPRRIIEIGSGFSTLVALDAVAANGLGEVVCIEPYPREFLKQHRGVKLIQQKAETLSAQWFNSQLEQGDILFIDSSHTVMTGSDCVHLYLRVLPGLRRSVTVHVHDIFLPMGYPKEWLIDRRWFWTEQYLLHALLYNNRRASVCYGTPYHQLVNPDLLEKLMAGRFPVGGTSLWFDWKGLEDAAPWAGGCGPEDFAGLPNLSAQPSPLLLKGDPGGPSNRLPRPATTRFPAVDCDASFGIERSSTFAGSLDDGDWMRFSNLAFSAGLTKALVSIATPAEKAGQRLEFHLDHPTGPLVASLTITVTGGWESFQTQQAALAAVSGVHDVYVVVRGYFGAGNLGWIAFE